MARMNATNVIGRDILIRSSIYNVLEEPMNMLEILEKIKDIHPNLNKKEANRFLYGMASSGEINMTKLRRGKPLFSRPTGASSPWPPFGSIEPVDRKEEVEAECGPRLRVYCDLGTKGKYKASLLEMTRQYPEVLFRLYATQSVATNLGLDDTTPDLRLTYSQEKNAISMAMSLDIGADLDPSNEDNNVVLLFGDTVTLSTLESELLPFCGYVRRHRDFAAFKNDLDQHA